MISIFLVINRIFTKYNFTFFCKFLFSLSSIGSGISLTILGLYTYINSLGYDVGNYSWIAIVSFSAMLFLASCGMMPLPYIVMGETMPEKVKFNDSVLKVKSKII